MLFRSDKQTGQMITASFSDYIMPRAGQLKSIQMEEYTTLSKLGPLGIKGMGESGCTASLPALVARLHDPEVRARILEQAPTTVRRPRIFETLYPLTEPLNYAPAPEDSVGAIAQREGRTAMEAYYDRMLDAIAEANGRAGKTTGRP